MAKPYLNIAIGEYIPVDSVLHRLDPRTKLVGLCAALIVVFSTGNPAGLVLTTAGVLFTAFLCRVGVKVWAQGARRFAVLLLITAGTTLLFRSQGRPVVVGGLELPLTYEGLSGALVLSLQVLQAITLSMVFTFTTTPVQLARAIERLGRSLGVAHRPVQDFGLVLLLAMRFVPVLQQELRGIVDAREARGVDLDHHDLVTRCRDLLAVLGPALAAALRRGDILAMAMSARGFRRGRERTEYKPLHFSSADIGAFTCAACFLVVLVLVGKLLPCP